MTVTQAMTPMMLPTTLALSMTLASGAAVMTRDEPFPSFSGAWKGTRLVIGRSG